MCLYSISLLVYLQVYLDVDLMYIMATAALREHPAGNTRTAEA